jgi:7,8-dihydropterin-6-yl-methyl-4-(beta-D-ribofuranosyl)aminobenzene 5'-phosphate synthase
MLRTTLLIAIISPGFSVALAQASAEPTPSCPAAVDDLTVTVVYDNNPGEPELAAEWGISCLVEGPERSVLFDTGGDGSALLANLARLGIGFDHVGAVVLSHAHGDHTSGLDALLEQRPDLPVFAPPSVAAELTPRPTKLVVVSGPLSIARGVCSTGEIDGPVPEQVLVVSTPKGLVVITGCAHPGIVEIVRRVKEAFRTDVLLIIGGFHLGRADQGTIDGVVNALHDLGVRHAAPCHCSGDAARATFARVFGDCYHEVHVGSKLTLADLQ